MPDIVTLCARYSSTACQVQQCCIEPVGALAYVVGIASPYCNAWSTCYTSLPQHGMQWHCIRRTVVLYLAHTFSIEEVEGHCRILVLDPHCSEAPAPPHMPCPISSPALPLTPFPTPCHALHHPPPRCPTPLVPHLSTAFSNGK